MTKIVKHWAAFVAIAGMYRSVSQHLAKALDQHHDYSTKEHAQDQGNGAFSSFGLICQDANFIANERAKNHPTAQAGGAATFLLDGEKAPLCEWPTGARLREISYTMTKAYAGGEYPEFADETDYWDNILDSFTVDTMTAFPKFTLWAEDPNDASFTPILLMPESVSSTSKQGVVTSVAALAFGVNNRKEPLMIVMRAEGDVIADSALFLNVNFAAKNAC